MKQIEIFEIPSPCIGICQSGPKGYCIGCFRSRDERLHWQAIDDEVKRKIIKACHLRRKRAEKEALKKRMKVEPDSSQGDTDQLDLGL